MSEVPGEIVIPWRTPASNPFRERNLRFVLEHLRAAGFSEPAGGPEPIVAEAYPWSPGAARNNGRRRVRAPVVCFVDADTITPPEQIRTAIRLAAAAPGLVYGYDLYLRIGQRSTERMLQSAGTPHWPTPEREILNAPSFGCAAISTVCFDELGGFDERFLDWGYEDVEFAGRAARWPIRRVPGVCFHLWHGERRPDDSPTDSERDLTRLNRRRLELDTIAASPVA